MRKTAFALTIISVLFFIHCNKPLTPIVHTNCDGLVTDTLGTGDDAKIFMPNAFSPNSDGIDDECRPRLHNIASVSFTIYDENNKVIFTTTDTNKWWNPGPIETTNTRYFYKIQGTTIANHKIGKCGEVYSLVCYPKNIPKDSLYFECQFTPNGFTAPSNDLISFYHCP